MFLLISFFVNLYWQPGPDTFEKASKMQMEPPDVQASVSHGQKPDVPVNLYKHNVSSSQSSHNMSPYNSQNVSSLSSQNVSSTDFGTNKATTSGSSRHEQRSSGAEIIHFMMLNDSWILGHVASLVY